MKTMFAVIYEDVRDDEKNAKLAMPIAVCNDEVTAWRYADVMPFECLVTEVVVVEPDSVVGKGIDDLSKNINDAMDRVKASFENKSDGGYAAAMHG